MVIQLAPIDTNLGEIELLVDLIPVKKGTKIPLGTKGLEALVVKNLKVKIDKALLKARPKIERAARRIIGQAIRSRKEYKSLLSNSPGGLRSELGLDHAEQRVETIVKIWEDSIKVVLKKTKLSSSKIESTLRLTMGNLDYSDVLSNPAAIIHTAKGDTLLWLEALLTFGDKIIVNDYNVFGGNFPSSRSGLSIMIKRAGSRWSVPSTYSGTARDNWLTRALKDIDKTLDDIIKKEFIKGI